VQTLDQCQQRGLATARRARQTKLLTGGNHKMEVLKYGFLGVGIAKRDVAKLNTALRGLYWQGTRRVRYRMALAYDLQHLGHYAESLRKLYQGQRQIARAMQDAKRQGADQDDIAGADRAGLPGT